MKRIGIVGCGAIAKTHGLCIQDLGFECVAVSDIRPEAAESFSRDYPELRADWLTVAEWMTTGARAKLREMFQSPKVYPNVTAMREAGLDALIIATLPSSHCDLVCEAAEIGVPVILCEKPMAMSVSECRKMTDACNARGLRLAVYNDSPMLLRQFVEARQLVGSGQIGKVEFVRAHTVSTLMDWAPYLWSGIHQVLPGRNIEQVEAMLDLSSRKISFGHVQEDRATVHFVMNDGLHGVLFTGISTPLGQFIRVDGSEGSLEVSFIAAPTLRVWRQGSKNWEVITPPRTCGYDDRREFLHGIATGDARYGVFDGISGLKSMAPVFAAWQSHLQRRPVPMNEVDTSIPLVHPI